jgi:hypothetical protein
MGEWGIGWLERAIDGAESLENESDQSFV